MDGSLGILPRFISPNSEFGSSEKKTLWCTRSRPETLASKPQTYADKLLSQFASLVAAFFTAWPSFPTASARGSPLKINLSARCLLPRLSVIETNLSPSVFNSFTSES